MKTILKITLTLILLQLLAMMSIKAMAAEADKTKTIYSYSLADMKRDSTTENLTKEERSILKEGPISSGTATTWGMLGTIVGFGLGHAVMGKWGESGWIYTLGETATLVSTGIFGVAGWANAIGPALCENCSAEDNRQKSKDARLYGTLALASGVGFLVFKGFEIYSVWSTPKKHNEKYKKARTKLAAIEKKRSPSFTLAPIVDDQTQGLGVNIRF